MTWLVLVTAALVVGCWLGYRMLVRAIDEELRR